MSSGVWNEGETKIRAGFYMRFIAMAAASIQSGARGIVAVPVKSNWGPPKKIVEITDESQLRHIYGESVSANFTAFRSTYLTLLGSPSTVLNYRLVDGTEKVASITLKDGAAASVLKLDTIYPTTREFNVTVRDSIADPAAKTEIILFEGTKKLYTFEVNKGSIDEIVKAINENKDNRWLKASKVAAGNGTLANVANSNLTGGNDGAANVTNGHYIDAMAAFEARKFNTFALDGATDAALQASVKSWTQRLRKEGKKILSFLGGTKEDDQNVLAGNTRSTGFNFEGVINVIVSGELNGVLYSSAEVACYAAGLVAGQALRESTTKAPTPFSDVSPRLTNSQIKSAIQAGSFVLTHDGEKVVCERGINTLTTLGEGQGSGWKKIKLNRIRDSIDTDLSSTGNDSYVGKILNNEDGQKALLSSIKNYFEELAPTLIDADFTVEVDEELMKNANGDQFFWKYSCREVDSMEEIYGTGYIR